MWRIAWCGRKDPHLMTISVRSEVFCVSSIGDTRRGRLSSFSNTPGDTETGKNLSSGQTLPLGKKRACG